LANATARRGARPGTCVGVRRRRRTLAPRPRGRSPRCGDGPVGRRLAAIRSRSG